MKLIQKAFLLPTFEFTLGDHSLRVKRSTLTASASFEIPFADIDPRPCEHENIGMGWYVIGGVLVVLGFLLVGATNADVTPDSLTGLWFGAFLSAITGLRCLAEGRKETFSELVFHSVRTGNALIHLRQTLPSPVHVQEFVEILEEKIEAEADEWKRHEDWRG